MKSQWFLVILNVVLLVMPLAAQDETPPAVREAALDAGEAARGVRAENWRFSALNRTSDSALGCPLVTGETMPVQVTPYRVELIYPDGVYVVHVSADGRMVQLCDTKFGEAMTSPAEATAEPDACKVTPAAAQPAYAAPDNTVPGIFTAAAGTAYEPFGRSSDGDWYQIASDIGVGWVETAQVAVSGDCADVPVNAFTAPDFTGPACFVTAAASLANVRSQPTTDAGQVAQIFENTQYQATARNTAADWYYIQPGWVAARVTTQLGDCNGLTVNDGLVGTGFALDLPGEMDESVAQALSQHPCAADFEGYLHPRIAPGFANAQVGIGGAPNALRSFPDVDDSIGQRLGVIQPGRTIDRILSGPVCNQGFVWWLVEFDGQIGWTAESNVEGENYFLEPLTGEQPVAASTAIVPSPTVSAPPDTDAAFTINDRPVRALVFNNDGSRLFVAGEEQGFGSGVNGFVSVWNRASGQSEGRIDVPTGIAALDYAPEGDTLLVASNSGVVTLYTASDPNLPATSTVDSAFEANLPLQPAVVINPDGTFFAALLCDDATCTTSRLLALNSADGTEHFTVDFDELLNALAISHDGTMLAAAGTSGVTFISVDEGEIAAQYTNSDNLPTYDIAFNADGSQVLFVGCAVEDAENCTRGRIGLVDVASTSLLGVVESHITEARIVAYNPDGTRFATTDSSGEIIIRNSATGIDVATYGVGEATVDSLAFTPDGTQLAAGTSTGQVLFFDAVGE